ncbi:MAG: Holliday junction branch migration protein RuvA [Bacteroidales bacterium]|jgi:Holliday junction DNA helicase RuvA|nr:Holliday junction branch migration protein RuvA [Bacteroidales bacterium]
MFAYIDGILVEKNPTYAVIDCHGVGYMLHISLNTYSKLQQEQQSCRLFTHLQIKEDAHILYGFSSQEERILFRMLIAVSGIGGSTAQMILSAMSASELITCIANGNADALRTIKGLGAKTTQRIVIELQDKIAKTGISINKADVSNNNVRNEALSALVLLGFSRQNAEKAVDKVLKLSNGDISIENLIKESLKIL